VSDSSSKTRARRTGERKQAGPPAASLIEEHIRTRAFAPVYYLHGDEDLLIEEGASAISDAVLAGAERSFNFDVADGAESDTHELLTIASTFPMMADRRVMIVKRADKIRESEPLEKYLANPAGTTVLIFTAEHPDGRRASHTKLVKGAVALSFPKLGARAIPAWVVRRAKDRGYRMTEQAAALLADYVGADLRDLQNELEKVFVFLGTRNEISADDIQTVSGMSREVNIYELNSAIGLRDSAKSTEILDRLLTGGQHPIRIIATLAIYFANLRKLADGRHDSGFRSDLRLSPGVVSSFRSALDRYSDFQIEEILLNIARADEQLKSSSLDGPQILHFLLASILAENGNSLGD